MSTEVYVVSVTNDHVQADVGFNYVWDVWVATANLERAKTMVTATTKHSDESTDFKDVIHENGACEWYLQDTQYVDHKPLHRTFRIQKLELISR